MFERIRAFLVPVLSVTLCLYVLYEVNTFRLQPESRLALFGMLGLVICFLVYPLHPSVKDRPAFRRLDLVLALLTVAVFGYVVVQSEPVFEGTWALGQTLGDRAGAETALDFWVGLLGLLLVLEATRRSIGLALPLLSLAFVAHAYYGEVLPEWLLPHAQMSFERIVSVTFLQSLGVFGQAMDVMFTYVFLFVIFGGFLEVTGATQFIVDFSQRLFGRSAGGPAKVAVLGSGLMGSLSGSAVANAVTTGAFTIPMMRNAGFQPHVAGGITAAAAAGGALVPPVMGAGAYMMLEFVDPPVQFLEIVKAALIPAMLYYFSIFMIVHFYAGRTGADPTRTAGGPERSLLQLMCQFEGIVFFGALGSLIAFLLAGNSPFKAVTYALGVIILLGLVHPRKRLTLGMARDALIRSAKNGISLVSASACVGIVIGLVQSTGVAGDFSALIAGVVEHSLLLALVGIMLCSIVLGMGVPSVVCYLLMATLMGGLLKDLGVIPLAAHLFIFYYGMMSMVTPPVALAAFASASIARADIMRTGLAAFRFSLVGFTLPFMFVYRPELLLMSDKPEVTVVRVEQANGAGPDEITGSLKRSGVAVGEAELEFAPANGSTAPLRATTDATGGFQVALPPRDWRVTYLRDEDDRFAIGTLSVAAAAGEGPGPGGTARFRDERLSALQVVVGLAAALLGIVALAAGITGYLRRPLNVALRGLSLGAAALLLLPSQGVPFGPVRVAMSDLVGVGIFALVVVASGLAGRAATPPREPDDRE